MTLRHLCALLLTACAALTALSVAPSTAQNKDATDPVRIGMTDSIFVDVPAVLVKLFAPSFCELTKECTGIPGQLVLGGDPFALTRKLNTNEVDFAVYQGVEFAWVSQKNPELVPLMVAINRHRFIKAHLVVRKDSAATGFADLKGKTVAYPLKSKEHCRLFLERHCADGGQCDPKTFFSEVSRPMSTERALDEVCGGKIQAAIVENVAWENYESIKPGCAARLKVLKTSETFPVAAIAYRKGAVSETVLNKFRDGMVAANKHEKTREMMNMYQITAFEPVPPDYAQTCAEIVRAYPAPEAAKVTSE